MKKNLLQIIITGIVCLTLLTTIQPVSAYSNEIKNKDGTLQPNQDVEDTGIIGPNWYNKPTGYAQLVSWYQALEALYPEYLEVFKANELYDTGIATGGYDLYYVRITNETLGFHKPEVLFLGNPHGDETVGTIGMFWFTDWLMRMAFTDEPCPDYSKDWLRWLIDNREIYLEVSHNPYGFDHKVREDSNGWDLNREADMDGPGRPTGGIWASVNGKTLHAFVDNHTIRVGVDFHGGARMLLYAWGSTHSSINGISPITGHSYTYAPPDFFFLDASSLRLGDYIGDYGGDLNQNDIGTTPGTVGYIVQGGIGEWAYGADIAKNPVEDPWVVGNYPGAGILWLSPEMSTTKNPAQSTFGNDTTAKFGAEVRRVILHQTDLAQPSVLWQYGTIENNSHVLPDKSVPLVWQVNGSLVVDHTSIQWGTNPDPIHHPEYVTTDHDEHQGDYYGGTGWDDANNGDTQGITYSENITISSLGEYYFVAKSQVDQIYANVLRPDVYGNHPYLRLLKERTNDSYYEELQGSDGIETITGQTWWYSPVIHVTVTVNNQAPEKPAKPSGQVSGNITAEYTYSTTSTDSDGNQVYYLWDWGDGTQSTWLGPFSSGAVVSAQKSWSKKGNYLIKVKAKDNSGAESAWSDPLPVTMPTITSTQMRVLFAQFLHHLSELFQKHLK
ncbi:Zinc carboxypeptidase [uncultured archaeon]|nr:Zinc carboxypeptidase [uncultured archaeon]